MEIPVACPTCLCLWWTTQRLDDPGLDAWECTACRVAAAVSVWVETGKRVLAGRQKPARQARAT